MLETVERKQHCIYDGMAVMICRAFIFFWESLKDHFYGCSHGAKWSRDFA